MIMYTLGQRWDRTTYRRCRFWQKKIIFSDEAHFDHVAFMAQKPRTHTLKNRRTQNESLFGADFGTEP